MRVIAKVDGDTYLCQIGHTEIENFMNLYYNKLSRLSVGDEVDLSKGYNFYKETRDALGKTEAFIKSNKDVIEMIVTGISLMTRGGDNNE